jgi:HlyD family secretion protein
MSKRTILLVLALIVVAGGAAWYFTRPPALPPGFASGNGRLEATDYYIAAKRPGRITEVLVDEGDTVEAGQVVARMDTEELEAALRQAEAKILSAQAQIKVAQADRAYAEAQVVVRKAQSDYATSTYNRSQGLVKRGAVSEQEAEIDFARKATTQAEVLGARAQVTQAASQIEAARADVIAGRADADRLRAEIKDMVLVSPIRARIESRLAEPGEVLASGGRILSMLDLSDVYMYVFLPDRVSGKIAMGSQARIVLDAAPDRPVIASVTYVSPEAQFTPKTVETAEERYNLTFRVKLQIPAARLKEVEPFVKSGVPGVGYVRYDPAATWPANLEPSHAPAPWQATGTSQLGAKSAAPGAGAVK